MASWRVFSKLLVCTSLIAVVSCVKMCENITVTSCSRAGYNTTARFPYVNGKRHQDLAAMNTHSGCIFHYCISALRMPVRFCALFICQNALRVSTGRYLRVEECVNSSLKVARRFSARQLLVVCLRRCAIFYQRNPDLPTSAFTLTASRKVVVRFRPICFSPDCFGQELAQALSKQ